MIPLSRFYSLVNIWMDWPSMLSSDVTTPLLWFMQKVKPDFQLANKEMSGNVYVIPNNCFTLFDRNWKDPQYTGIKANIMLY